MAHQNEKKNSNKYLKNINFAYQTDYKIQKRRKKSNEYKINVQKILFWQNLKKKMKRDISISRKKWKKIEMNWQKCLKISSK